MTKPQVRQMVKNTALNKIRRIYFSNFKIGNDFWEESISERKERLIRNIIEDLEEELEKLDS